MAEKEQKTQKKIEKNTEVEELNQVDSSVSYTHLTLPTTPYV